MNTAVKAHVLVCIVLVAASTVLAQQQPAEWRPSIAEDNKAATLDDTLKFVVKTVNDTSVDQRFDPQDGYFAGAFRETFGTASPAKCSIEWNDLLVRQDGIIRWRIAADLTKVDALSISVTPLDFGKDGKDFTKGFLVSLSGPSGSEFADSTYLYRYYYSKRLGHDLSPDKRAFISEAESASCPSGNNKKCFVKQTKETHASLFLADQEAAHRVARALMHAALLCGGAKAVSPF